MANYLTNKIINETKTPEGKKLYTVKNLRSMVRQEIKDVNKIIADLSQSDKDRFISEYTKQIGEHYLSMDKLTGEFLTQVNVKFMGSKRLRATYNALQAVKEATTADTAFAQRLAEKKQKALDEWNKNRTEEEQITSEEYDEIIDVFNEYEDLVNQYGYNEILDEIQKRKAAVDEEGNEPIWKQIKAAEKELDAMGIVKTKENVLIYIENKDAFIEARNNLIMEKIMAFGVSPEQAAEMITFDMINERIGIQ